MCCNQSRIAYSPADTTKPNVQSWMHIGRAMAVLILDVTGVLADAFIDVLENTLQLTELALSTANIRAGFRISG